jgi:hypothetical protein
MGRKSSSRERAPSPAVTPFTTSESVMRSSGSCSIEKRPEKNAGSMATSRTLRCFTPCRTTHAISRSLTPRASVMVSCMGTFRRSRRASNRMRTFSGFAWRRALLVFASRPSNCNSTSVLSRNGTSFSATPAFSSAMPLVAT